jgi:23S rRNA pseudouridine955/2504/2580 synthase
MSGVQSIEIGPNDGDIRLDRWFRRHFPGLNHIQLEKLLRTGQVRVDGGRVKAAHRLEPGMVVRVPPLDDRAAATPEERNYRQRLVKPAEAARLKALVLYRDDEVIAIDTPPDLAVQGGTNQTTHLDGMLDALQFEASERPRLVHRLDKDTSGVLLLARTAKSAAWLAAAFRDKTARKTYWAATAGVPRPHRGKIDLPVAKARIGTREKMAVDEDMGDRAVTYYSVLDQAAQKAAWTALMPLTGRTHQLRIHLAAIGTPILGDGKYGGGAAVLAGLEHGRKLHLHARSIALRRPDGALLQVTAPLPAHMRATWAFFGFAGDTKGDPFAELELDQL